MTDREFVVIKIDSPIKAAIVAVYRPPKYNNWRVLDQPEEYAGLSGPCTQRFRSHLWRL